LFVVDLSDPVRPAVTGQLDVPGYSTYIDPRGDRLIAVGIDDQQGQRPAIVLYNVPNPKAPTQLSRIVLGPPGSFTESQAVFDEKAFKVVDELGLIAIPFHYAIYTAQSGSGDTSGGSVGSVPIATPAVYQAPTCTSAVQLIDFSADRLVQRGWFDHR